MTVAVTHATAADGTFSTAGAAAWNAGHSVTGVANKVATFDSGGALSDGSGLSWGTAAGQGLALVAGTAASAVSALSITQEWNYNGAAINAVDWTFTDTSSHANTLALRIRGGASGTTNLLSVSKSGLLTGPGGAMSISLGATASSDITIVNSNTGRWLFLDADKIQFRGGTGNPVIQLNSTNTGISEVSAGIVGIGTGAAGSVAGTIRLTAVQDASANQVVGARGAAVADASGGAVIDAEARTALNALLARVRTHGLIAT